MSQLRNSSSRHLGARHPGPAGALRKRPLAALLCLALGLGLTGAAPGATAAEDDDMDALMLANKTEPVAAPARQWKAFVEGAFGQATRRADGASENDRRLSLELQYDGPVAQGLRGIVADRIDIDWLGDPTGRTSINTLKEAYLSWQARPDLVMDVGRINVRNGVATGYNPTDFFRARSLRSVVSADPASLKENRQGSVMLRGQALWNSGSVTAIFSPRIDDDEQHPLLRPGWRATNQDSRVLVAVSQKFDANITPQVLVYKANGAPVQLGANVTSLIGDATVAYAEWAGGRGTDLLTQARQSINPGYQGETSFRHRLATGLSHTTAQNITLIGELEFNGGGLNEGDWNRLGPASPPLYGQYRNWLQAVQELPTRRAAFFYGTWHDALLNHLDLSLMQRYDITDSSRLSWLEARYRLAQTEFAFQWQRNSGSVFSNYGAIPERSRWQALVRHYF